MTNSVSGNTNRPMINKPVRNIGETEMRQMHPYALGELSALDQSLLRNRRLRTQDDPYKGVKVSISGKPIDLSPFTLESTRSIARANISELLENSEYLARRHILATREDFRFNEIMKENGLSEISEEEAKRLQAQRNMEIFLSLDAHHFQVEENFYELLKPVMENIRGNEIRLPYEWSIFHLNYYVTSGQFSEPIVVMLHQDQETKAVTSHAIVNGELVLMDTNLHLKEALAVCVALDAEIIGKSCIAGDLGRPTKKDSVFRRTFKILRLKTAKKFIDNIHFVNTGRKAVALHFRRGCWVNRKGKRFWRRSTIVGKIEFGVVEKVYQV